MPGRDSTHREVPSELDRYLAANFAAGITDGDCGPLGRSRWNAGQPRDLPFGLVCPRNRPLVSSSFGSSSSNWSRSAASTWLVVLTARVASAWPRLLDSTAAHRTHHGDRFCRSLLVRGAPGRHFSFCFAVGICSAGTQDTPDFAPAVSQSHRAHL